MSSRTARERPSSRALAVFVDTLDGMEITLAGQSWLSGERFGLADASLLPYVLRLEHLALDPLIDRASQPGVADWLSRVKARPRLERAVQARAPAAAIEMMRSGGREVWPEIEPLARTSAPHRRANSA